jgi:hypothetical protein
MDRIAILLELNSRRTWGTFTSLSRRYKTSRQFLYLLQWGFRSLVGLELSPAREKPSPRVEVVPDELLLALRLQGGVSEGDLAAIFRDLHLPYQSVGAISGKLNHFAMGVPRELPKVMRPVILLVDEIFHHQRPILVVIDAQSHFILRAQWSPDRQKDSWKALLQGLQAEGFEVIGIVADMGKGLCGGAKAAEIEHFPDLKHLLRPLDSRLIQYERKAYRAIRQEYERERIFWNAKGVTHQEKSSVKYEAASRQSGKAVAAFDAYRYLMEELRRSLEPFDSRGEPRSRENVKTNLETLISLLEAEFNEENTAKGTRQLRDAHEGYLVYFDRVKAILAEFAEEIPGEILRESSLAWQEEKKSAAVKSYPLKKAYRESALDRRFLAESYLENGPARLEEFFRRLDGNVRSSSPVESINALLRDYLNNSRGQISQEILDLLVFYLNHRVQGRGKYKGTSAYERLTGIPETGSVIQQILSYGYAEAA